MRHHRPESRSHPGQLDLARYVLTDLTQAILDENPALHDEWVARIPQDRIAKPEDLPGLVTFLASDPSAYLNAQDIVIDGGYTAV